MDLGSQWSLQFLVNFRVEKRGIGVCVWEGVLFLINFLLFPGVTSLLIFFFSHGILMLETNSDDNLTALYNLFIRLLSIEILKDSA